MNYKYQDDGSDPGLSVFPYDSDDYTSDYDYFGERIGPAADDDDYSVYEDLADDQPAESDTASALEDGFGETLNPDNTHLSDQLEDDTLREAAEADYEPDEPATR